MCCSLFLQVRGIITMNGNILTLIENFIERGKRMGNYLLISDAAKEVKVESHVLRYWEEELHLPIKRNELGHRYYTEEDVERFKQIKSMKERGLQLKAIKMILRDGKLDVLTEGDEIRENKAINPLNDERRTINNERKAAVEVKTGNIEKVGTTQVENGRHMAIDIVNSRNLEPEIVPESKEEKSRRLQWLLQQLIRETLVENNQDLCREIKESVVKELDYQFRAQEEREDERDRRQIERSEEYYKKMDELLRAKNVSGRKKRREKAAEEKAAAKKAAERATMERAAERERAAMERTAAERASEKAQVDKLNAGQKPIDIKTRKRKRHFIF